MSTDVDWAGHHVVAIDDELRRVPRDDLATARREWEARAGRKGEHEIDTEALEGLVRSTMPSQGR